MKTILRLALPVLMLSIAWPAMAEELPLKRVVITTSGLALYEHSGTVTGNQDIDLSVRLDRVDDILKSLVVMDDKGKLGGVALPGREPLSQAFRDLPFTQADLKSPVTLLNALQGADVQIVTGKETLTGKLMNVIEEKQHTENGDITRHRVTVLTSDGIRSALLESLDRLQFTDKTVQDQLQRALGATFGNRIKDQRNLKITLTGEGERTVSMAYIQEAPLWKSSYRLILPQKIGDKATLQGWAVMENTTGQDWHDVRVMLMSGSPVTYQQALYQSYYVPRPDLPVKVMDRILPRVDKGSLRTTRDDASDLGAGAENLMKNLENDPNARWRRIQPEKATMAAATPAMAADMAMEVTSYAPNLAMAQAIAAQAGETASQLTFAFPQAVTLPAGNTLMLPFISQDLPAGKLYVYQSETNPEHPLAAISLSNDTGNGLPPGILTLFDRKDGLVHVGDADMPMVPKGENRFISFALDTKTKIQMEQSDENRMGLFVIANGTLSQKVLTLSTTKYTIKAPDDEERIIVIELPKQEGWELEKPEGIIGEPETTSTHYRVKIKVDAGKTSVLSLTLRHDEMQAIALTDISPYELSSRISAAGRDLPADLRKVLEKVKDLRAVVYDAQTTLQRIQQERDQIANDQSRLRENLKTISSENDLGKRYLKEMNAQEDRLDALKNEQAAAQQKYQDGMRALNEYLRSVKL
jgi:hypothetical protein